MGLRDHRLAGAISQRQIPTPNSRDTQSVDLKTEFLAKIDHARSRMHSIATRLRKRPMDSRDYDRQTVAIMERVLDLLSQSLTHAPRANFIVYVNPVHRDVIAARRL